MRSPALRNVRANSGITFRPDASCVLWYPGQDDPQSAVIRDRSGNGNNGTIDGATWTRTGQGLWYLDFDGVDNLVTVTDSASITDIFDGGGTVVAWINAGSDGEGGFGMIWNKGDYFSVFDEAAGKVKLRFAKYFSGDDGAWVTTATEVTINTWTFAAVTYNASGTAFDPIFYVNGAVKANTESGTPTGTRDSKAGADLTIGNRSIADLTFDGGLALVRSFDEILTATRILDIYNQERHLFGI